MHHGAEDEVLGLLLTWQHVKGNDARVESVDGGARRTFGSVPVQKLTPAALADWAANLTGKRGRPLAPATKRRAIIRLKSVLAHARKMRWVTWAMF